MTDQTLTQSTIERCMAELQNALDRGIGAAGSADDFVCTMHTRWVRVLLKSLPTLAGPWHVTDMRRGETTRMERAGWGGEPIAVVKRRGKSSWSAFVGNTLIEAPESEGAGSINWPTCDAAQIACDARMASDGVRLGDAEVAR